MGLISPNRERYFVYFDKVPRSQVVEKLWSFIFASGWAMKETDVIERKKSIINRLKDTFNIAQENGAGTYGNNPTDIANQFSRQYTIGWDLGIWKNSDLDLSDNALEVFNGDLSIKEYISRFSINLFQYINGVGYTHPLYLTCEYAIKHNKTVLSKDDFLALLPNTATYKNGPKEFAEHTQMFMNYLSATYFFDKEITGNSFNLIFKEPFTPQVVMDLCNLDYSDKDQQDTQRLLKNDDQYSNYISKKLPSNFYKLLLNLSESETIINFNSLNLPHQQIFSGAPGTGKSYQLNKDANKFFSTENSCFYKRVTFHPNMNYGQFVGVFKPFPSGNKEAPITYKFIPGVLLKQLEEAYRNPSNNYLVIIEEINRANVAAVFGDMFQLLDRKDGISEYPISISEDLLLRFMDDSEGILGSSSTLDPSIKLKLESEGLFFPKNFYIWASMNSADQGVMPMDTAFKRRWEFKKFDINDLGDNGIAFFKNKLIRYDGGHINWNELRMVLNSRMLELKIPEDKLMGPYFLSKEILNDPEKITKSFESKVLMYLFDDAVKMKRNSFFNLEDKNMQYSSLLEKFKQSGSEAFFNIDIKTIFDDEKEDIIDKDLMNLPSSKSESLSKERKKLLIHLQDRIYELNTSFEFGEVSNGIYVKREGAVKRDKFLFIEQTGSKKNAIMIQLSINHNENMPDYAEHLNGSTDKFKVRFELNNTEQIDEIVPYITEAFESRHPDISNTQEN